MLSWWHQSSGWFYVVLSFGMIALLALLAWGVADIRRIDRRVADRARSNQAPAAGAERIAAELFTRGEIDAGDHHHRLADLQKQRHVGASYPDLHLMGGEGIARRQAQVLNRRDDVAHSDTLAHAARPRPAQRPSQ